jgi:hypothetical protein
MPASCTARSEFSVCAKPEHTNIYHVDQWGFTWVGDFHGPDNYTVVSDWDPQYEAHHPAGAEFAERLKRWPDKPSSNE